VSGLCKSYKSYGLIRKKVGHFQMHAWRIAQSAELKAQKSEKGIGSGTGNSVLMQ
jgi:hypothetical protein